MSKEIAQTVGGKKIAWLIAIVAAFAVFATLGSQWQKSSAALPTTTASISQTTTSTTPGAQVAWTVNFAFSPAGVASAGTNQVSINFDDALTFVSATGSIDSDATTVCANSGAGNVVTCTVSANYQNGTVVATFTNPASGAIAAPTGCQISDTTTVACTGTPAGYTIAGVTGSGPASVAAGANGTFTLTIPAGLTYCSDSDGNGARSFQNTDVVITNGTLVSATPALAATSANDTLVVVATAGATPPLGVAVRTHLATSTVTNDCATSDAIEAAGGVPELRHISDNAVAIAAQDLNNNVRGSRHTICTVAQNTGIDGNDDGDTDGGAPEGDIAAVPVQIPGITLANIAITNGGGYANTLDTDPDFTDVRIFVGTGNSNNATEGLSGATCISWVSTDAGDQQINIVYVGADAAQYNASWDTDGDGNGQGIQVNRALIKEWNRIQPSVLTIDEEPQGAAQNVSLTKGLILNPATGGYQIAGGPVAITDLFPGKHTNSAGGSETPGSLAGVYWTISEGGCDAAVTYANTSSGTTVLNNDGSVGNTPAASVEAGACLPGQSVTLTFTGSETGPLGSGTTLPVTETVTITFTQNVAEKQVFLAWAGQRIILEHDWRLPAGDGAATSTGPTYTGVCPFDSDSNRRSFQVQYVKGTGPGNFVAGLNADVEDADLAWLEVWASDTNQTIGATNNDIISDPQGNCISRVLYESEDPGEVDIEAFAYGNDNVNATKVAFVVYYMKINTINVSLVTQVSKPSHNSSTVADYAPGNPWDASKDDADNAADWNVSKDLLVRGRVTGWFLNSNPSGRAADTSNPLNVLPANRWVMPQDWPLLAGGPADPADGTDAIGTAEQFRPYYDIMFAPNSNPVIALGNPDGTSQVQLAVVATGNTGKGTALSPIKVLSCDGVNAGQAVYVGTVNAGTVTSCAAGSLVVSNGPLTAAPAAGTGVYLVTGVPFEGPYSLLDIVGFAADGNGGAALSNLDASNSSTGKSFVGGIRDTAAKDRDVDMWDAPMPPAPVSVAIRGTGFIKQVTKSDVYYLGTPNTSLQVYPNPFYIVNVPDSPFIPAVVAGGGFLWNSWGNDGPGGNGQGVYRFWEPVLTGTNSEGVGETLSTTDNAELAIIRAAYGDNTIARDLVVFTDNHGEFMVTANGDFKTDLTACTTNVLAGGKHCKPGDKVGTGTITATVDYPDFRGKHFPVLSNAATVTWTWGGYKDVTVENGETDQYKYIVFHAMDRDGFCSAGGTGAVLLHSVLSGYGAVAPWNSALGMDDDDTDFSGLGARYNGDPDENVDFLIDSGEGIIIGQSGSGDVNEGRQFATGVPTFSVAENNPASTGVKEFPLSSLAASGQTDECQAWIKVSNSLLGILNVLATANDDEGNIGFDKIIDLTNTTSYTLNFRWSLITWAGADSISVSDAIKGTGTSGKNPGGNDISASVTAIYGWDASAQQWLGYFPTGVNVPGANDLNSLSTGQAYWIAITGPSSVTWTIASNVN